ncbi:MAG: patatin-like phospholipase family protein [Bacteroidota bacterium]
MKYRGFVLAALAFVILPINALAVSARNDSTQAGSTVIRPLFDENAHHHVQLINHPQVRLPRVAVVLSGGGARGISSVGVLKALERNDIPVNLIVGTSIGSIIGGLYAAGYSTADLQLLADTTLWSEVLSYDDEARRRDMFLDQKLATDRSLLVLRFNGLEPIIPSSLSTGHQLTNYLNLLALQGIYHPNPTFDEMRIPFRAVTTDLISGKQVVLKSGDLSEAMRASVAVPLLFSSVRKDTMQLLDGGLIANIPVDVARDEGAEIVVAVDVTSPLRPAHKINAPWEIGEQLMGIMMQMANRTALEKADLVITPNLGGHISSDFTGLDSLIELGERATELAIPRLKALLHDRLLAMSGPRGREYKNPQFEVERILLSDKFGKWVDELGRKPGVSEAELREFLTELYEEGDYQNVEATVQEGSDRTRIGIHITPNPFLTSVSVVGAEVLSQDSLLAGFRPLLGKRLNNIQAEKALEEVLSLYREHGYSLARILDAKFDSTSGAATISLEEGRIYRIEIEGTTKTRDYVIWRELPWQEGDIFQVEKIAQGLTNLYGTNLFEQALIRVHREGEHNIVVINVRERSTELIRFGMRIDNERNIQPSIDVRDENFLGIGAELGVRAFGGGRNQSYIGEFIVTRIFNSYLTFGLRGYSLSRDINVYSDEPEDDPTRFNRVRTGEFRELKTGWSASFGSQLERLGSVTIEGRLEKHRLSNLFNQPIDNDEYTIRALRFGTRVDTKDKFPFTTDGIALNFSYETALSSVGSAVSYTKMLFGYDVYRTLFNRHTLHPRFVLGLADESTPVSELFTIGGQESFFGFREDNARGRQLFLASIEYQYALPFRIFFDTYLKVRYDFGSIWAKPEEIRFIDLHHGLGIGVGFDTAVGPAEFSLGRSFYLRKDLLDRPLSLGPLVGYFSIGYPL